MAFSSILLNFAAVPLVGFIMIAGYIFLPLSFILPFLGNPMAFILTEAVKLFSWLCRLLDPIPFLSYRIPTPPDAVVIAAYASLLLMLLPRRFKGQKRITVAAFALVFLVLVTYPFPPKSSSGLKVTVLDVGQGDSILVEFPGRRKMLVDGGGTTTGSFDVGERIVSPFLWRKGIKKIDILVLTHAHPDHLNGLPAVARNFRIGEFWEADKPAEIDSHNRLLADLGSKVMRREVRRGFSRTLDGVTIEALHPAPGEAPAGSVVDNDRSLVLKLSRGGLSILLAGDIGGGAEDEIMASVPDIRCRVLKAPHHGSATSSSAEFLARVSPEIVVIPVGKANRYGFPQKEVLDRYAAIRARVFRTDFDGAVEISEAGGSPRVRKSVGVQTDRQGLPGD